MPSLYGLIGYPLTHSFSPAYFKKKFAQLGISASYDPFPIPAITDFPGLLLSKPDLEGLNVTIPYKETVIPYLDELDNVAAEIGAVNCIVIKNGKTKGYNTDATGFEQSLNPYLKPQHKQALILGTGGSSKAVAWVLKQLGITYRFVSRTAIEGCLTYSQITPETIAQHKLIVNTTPAGLYPNIDDAPPLPYECIGTGHLLFDLIYNPEETKFILLGKAQGATVKNGFEMLQLQAEAAWDIWTSSPIPE